MIIIGFTCENCKSKIAWLVGMKPKRVDEKWHRKCPMCGEYSRSKPFEMIAVGEVDNIDIKNGWLYGKL